MPPSDRPQAFRVLPVTLLFAGLTVVVTWPQAAHLGTHGASHIDTYFSLWRIAWIAHALATDPTQLYHANVFYPQRYTLALSDPVLLEGLVAAPMIWAGASALLAYNLLVLGSFVLCGVTAAALGFAITRSHAAGILGGMVFAFAPYRFEHYFHLELLWAFWMPLAFLGLQRALGSARLRDGVTAGLAVVGQTMSCLYYAIYLGVGLVVAAPFLMRWRDRRSVCACGVLAAGAAIAAIVALVYVQPLLTIRAEVAERSLAESARYSATAMSYLSAHRDTWLWGWTSGFGRPETRLFPGLAAAVLGLVGAIRGGRVAWAYAGVLIVSVLASMGSNAPLFGSLRQLLDPYGMVRVPARFAAVGLCALAALTAIGAAALLARSAGRRRTAGVAGAMLVMLAEYAARPSLMAIPRKPGPAYQWLVDQPPAPLVELPFPSLGALPGPEPMRQYYSTLHWRPLLNGYSGYYPVGYFDLVSGLRRFPRGRWIDRLLNRGARYIFVHESGLERATLNAALEPLERHPRMVRIGRFVQDGDAVWVYAERETVGDRDAQSASSR